MGQQKHRRSKANKSARFKPDSQYIKKAMEEFESRGGMITKLSTINSFDKTMIFDEDMQVERNQNNIEFEKIGIHSID